MSTDDGLRHGERDQDLAPEVLRRRRCRAGDCELEPQRWDGSKSGQEPESRFDFWLTVEANLVRLECSLCARHEQRWGPWEIGGLTVSPRFLVEPPPGCESAVEGS